MGSRKPIFAITTWCILVASGFAMWTRHDQTAGAQSDIASAWPRGTSLPQSTTCPTLVVFLHPQCPCSRATVDELKNVLAHSPPPLATLILLVCPPGDEISWHDTPLVRSLPTGPGISLVDDINGVETYRFLAATSGQCFLFSKDGRLLFQGGITSERGQVGPNHGENALIAALKHADPSPPHQVPVYGCSLLRGCTRPLAGVTPR